MCEHFCLRHLLETRQYGQLNKAKLEPLGDLSRRLRHSATESRSQDWSKAVATKERFGPY